MSFCEKTKLLHKFYDSQPDIEAIPFGKLKAFSKQVDLTVDEIESWFEGENARLQKHLARRDFNQHQSSIQLPPSPARTSTYGRNNTVNRSMQENSSLLPTFIPQINNTPNLTVPSEHLTTPLKPKRGRPKKNQPPTSLDSLSPNVKRRKFWIYSVRIADHVLPMIDGQSM